MFEDTLRLTLSVYGLKERLREGSVPRSFLDDIRPPDETEIYRAFAFGRVGLRPYFMLCVIKCDDALHGALPSVVLRSGSTSDPLRGFPLEFSSREILTERTHLEVCFCNLRDHRLSEYGGVNEIVGKFGGPEALRTADDKLESLIYTG